MNIARGYDKEEYIYLFVFRELVAGANKQHGK